MVYIGGLPVFYWPVLATDLLKPTFYVDQARFARDSVFGTQALIDWDVFQVLGLSKDFAPGSEWTVSTHLRRIFAKLGVHSRAAMAAYVATHGPASQH